MSDRRHFRCSELATALQCYGSPALRRRVLAARGDRTTPAALMGNWCHADGALTLISAQGACYNGDKPIVRPAYKVNGFAQWISSYYVTAVSELTSADMGLEVESEFDSDELAPFARFRLTGHIDCFGMTADATEAVGFDLKAGVNLVTEASDNPQVLGYIVLLKLAYPTLRKITFYIVQPQNDPDEGYERITEVTIEGEENLRAAVAYMERELNHACDNPYTLNSDGRGCGYCDAALTCPAIEGDLEDKDMKMTLTEEQFNAIPVIPDAAKLARLEIAAKKFRPIFDAAHDELKERLKAGAIEVDGARFYLEDRPGKRTITDTLAAAEALKDLPDEAYHRTYEFKPGAIEEELAAWLKLPKKSAKNHDARKEYNARLGAVTDQKTNKVLKIG